MGGTDKKIKNKKKMQRNGSRANAVKNKLLQEEVVRGEECAGGKVRQQLKALRCV